LVRRLPGLSENPIVKQRWFRSVAFRRLRVLCWLGAGWLALALSVGLAQEVKAQAAPPVWKTDQRIMIQFPGRITVLKTGAFANPAEQQQFIDYYTKDFFPRWTLPESRGRQPYRPPPASTTDFIRDLNRDLKLAAAPAAQAGQRQVYDYLSEITLENMSRMAKGKLYHPATRLNATLMIGELNVPEAIPALLKLAADTQQSDVVRVAAMVGLVRHANPDIHPGDAVGISEPATIQLSEPATVQAVTAAMVAIAGERAGDLDKVDGVNWLRGRAAEVLGLLGSTGNSGSAVKALGAMVHDAKLPIPQRCLAAYALGQLNYGGVTLAAGPYLDALGGLARDALTARQKGSLSGPRLKGSLQDVLAGVRGSDEQHTGIGPAAKTAAEQAVRDGLLRVLDPLCDLLDDVNLSNDTLKTKIDDALRALEPLLKGP